MKHEAQVRGRTLVVLGLLALTCLISLTLSASPCPDILAATVFILILCFLAIGSCFAAEVSPLRSLTIRSFLARAPALFATLPALENRLVEAAR